jgi:hypothetical protein
MLNAAPIALGRCEAIVLVCGGMNSGLEHLVPPARDRILGRGREAQQHVPRGRLAGKLLGAMDLEGGRAVVEEGNVIEPKRLGDGGIVFMARAADRVESLAARLQPARDPVELAARALAVEQFDHGVAGKADVVRPHLDTTTRQRALA